MSFLRKGIKKAFGKPAPTPVFAEGQGGVRFEVIESTDLRVNEEVASFTTLLKRVTEGPLRGHVGGQKGYLLVTRCGKHLRYLLERKEGGDPLSIDIRISVPVMDYSKTGVVQTWRAQTWRDFIINGDEWRGETLSTAVDPGVTVKDMHDRMEKEERAKYPQEI